MVGTSIPLIPMQHQVVWTCPLAELDAEKPVPNMRDPDNLVYFRQDGSGFAMGGYERNPRSFSVNDIPSTPDPTRLVFDEVHFSSLMEGACRRVPLMRGAPLARTLNGLESFTADGEFILGESAETAGFWVACGFCAHGVSGSGGVGKALAEWVVTGSPGYDLSHMDVRRFSGRSQSHSETLKGVMDIYSTYYDVQPG